MRLRVQGMATSAVSLVSATLERNGENRTVIDNTNRNLVNSNSLSLERGGLPNQGRPVGITGQGEVT